MTNERRLRLTRLGDLTRRYGVQTPPQWWRAEFRAIKEVQSYDGDWEQMVHERIEGLQQLLHDVALHGTDWFNHVEPAPPDLPQNPDPAQRDIGAKSSESTEGGQP